MVRIDEYPTHELNGVKYRCGRVLPFGASFTGAAESTFPFFQGARFPVSFCCTTTGSRSRSLSSRSRRSSGWEACLP